MTEEKKTQPELQAAAQPALPEAPKSEEPKLVRVFVYDGREFPDPDPKMTADEVRQYYVAFFPELANAEILAAVVRPSKLVAGTQESVTEFKRRVGVKGETKLCVADKAQQLWQDMNIDEKAGVRFGMLPFAKISAAEREGYLGRELAVALMQCAKNDGGMVL